MMVEQITVAAASSTTIY